MPQSGLRKNHGAITRFFHLEKERTIAKTGYNRWMMPPSALAIHLCIGMSYGFSVFWIPMSQLLGKDVAKCTNFWNAIFTQICNWDVSHLVGSIFPLFFMFLGGSAALLGKWVERSGPRKVGFASAWLWTIGLLIAAFGVKIHSLAVICLGAGMIGGVGLGLGYISPVSTLIKWFPDHRGEATGMAIMGFGGGALIGSPLANWLMVKFLGNGSQPDVAGTLVVLALIYFVFMMYGAYSYRIPPMGWRPPGWAYRQFNKREMISQKSVDLSNVAKTPQFWLLWAILMFNVSAGIGILAVASPMIQTIFGGALIGEPNLSYAQLSLEQKTSLAAIGAAFTGMLSIGNVIGRFLWAWLSDWVGRKVVYFIFFFIGFLLFTWVPISSHIGNLFLFLSALFVILTMYGGGFATIPAYLADLFGAQFVGAIHGRLLTAWALAGVVGPLVVTSIQNYELSNGVPLARSFDLTLYVLSGFMVLGFFANIMVRPVLEKWHMSDAEVNRINESELNLSTTDVAAHRGIGKGSVLQPLTLLVWSVVVIPLLWGMYVTLRKLAFMF